MGEDGESEAGTLEAYLRVCADVLGLTHWTVNHNPVLCDDAIACVDFADGFVANMRFSDTFKQATPEEQREIVAHEFVHVMMHPISNVVTAGMGTALKKKAFKPLYALYEAEEENLAETIGRLIAPMLPLPEL